MRDETQRTADAIRGRSSEVENHLIDEYRTGYIDRREFVRRGAVMGMSATALGLLASACGRGGSCDTAPVVGGKGLKSKVKPGGVVKAAINSPAGRWTRSASTTTAASPCSGRRASSWPGRIATSSSSRAWQRAGRPIGMDRCGRSSSAGT